MYFSSVNDATAPPAPDTRSGGLRARILSALVLAPLALAAVWAGAPWFEMMIALATGLAAWEWCRMCGLTAPVAVAPVVLAGPVAAAVAAVALIAGPGSGPGPGLGAAGAMAFLALLASLGWGRRAWGGIGALYLGVPAAAAVWLREGVPSGHLVMLWLVAVVWATDIAAYAAGRSLGGPRLAPRLSPGKTWSGLAGGVAAAGLVGYGLAAAVGAASPAVLGWLGALMAVVSQGGDIAESALKRHFGVKDAGSLIPGHGGVLDRIDGLLAALVLAAVLAWLGGGALPGWR